MNVLESVRWIPALVLLGALSLPAHASGGPPPPGAGGPHELSTWGPPPGVPGAPMGPRPPRPLGPSPEELERVGLSDAQRDRLADLHDDEMRTVIRLDADARIAERDLERLLTADHPDAHAIDEQVGRLASLRAELLRGRVSAVLALHEVLTPAQWSKLRRARRSEPPGP